MPMLSTGMILSAMLETIEMSCIFLSKVFLHILFWFHSFYLSVRFCTNLIPLRYDISTLVCDLYCYKHCPIIDASLVYVDFSK